MHRRVSHVCQSSLRNTKKKCIYYISEESRVQPVWILKNWCPQLVQKCKILNFKIKEKLIANSESEWTKSSHETPKHTLLRTWYCVQTSSTPYQTINDQTYKLPANNNKRITIGPVSFLKDYKQIIQINSLGKIVWVRIGLGFEGTWIPNIHVRLNLNIGWSLNILWLS